MRSAPSPGRSGVSRCDIASARETMSRVFIEFWRLRRQTVPEEAVRGGSRRRRTDAAWSLPPALRSRLGPLLEPHGFDLSRDVSVEEVAGQDGFFFSQ